MDNFLKQGAYTYPEGFKKGVLPNLRRIYPDGKSNIELFKLYSQEMAKEGVTADNVIAKLLEGRNAASSTTPGTSPPEPQTMTPAATEPVLNWSYYRQSLQNQYPGVSQATLKRAFDSAERQDSINSLEEVTFFFKKLDGEGTFNQDQDHDTSPIPYAELRSILADRTPVPPTDDNLASMWRAQQAISGGMSDADLLAHIAESTATAPDTSTTEPRQTDDNDDVEAPASWEDMHAADEEEHGITGGQFTGAQQTINILYPDLPHADREQVYQNAMAAGISLDDLQGLMDYFDQNTWTKYTNDPPESGATVGGGLDPDTPDTDTTIPTGDDNDSNWIDTHDDSLDGDDMKSGTPDVLPAATPIDNQYHLNQPTEKHVDEDIIYDMRNITRLSGLKRSSKTDIKVGDIAIVAQFV
jgi:hypothetical protein